MAAIRLGAIGLVLALGLAACGDDDDDGGGEPGSASGGGAGTAGQAGAGAASAQSGGTGAFSNPTGGQPSRPLVRDAGILPDVGGCGHLEVRNLDLLFMVDDSRSMREEQEALRREFPKMIRVLTTGDRDADGKQDFPPIAALHLGVVSSDMGIAGILDIPGCSQFGKDGLLQHVPAMGLTGCKAEYPPFLSFTAGSDDPDQVASDFACIATLGTAGCGFEQQLESTLKALWPASDSQISFLPDANGLGKTGHGDVENAGFLRPSHGAETSMLAVVLVTDEDDCSSSNTQHFTPMHFLPADDPLAKQGLNTRCHFHPENLYPIKRYVDGLRALRPDSQNLIVFGAITGVPIDLVKPDRLAQIDFENDAMVSAFYDDVLANPDMQEMVDDKTTPDPQDDDLRPACTAASTTGTFSKAMPARRIVQVAQQFGKNSIIQSICQDDFGPAIDAIVLAITRAAKNACIVM